MAERIDQISRRRGPGRPPLYPWDTWMDGSAWRLSQGEDFDISPTNMAIAIRERSRRLGVPVECSVNSEAGTVEFKFSPVTVGRAA